MGWLKKKSGCGCGDPEYDGQEELSHPYAPVAVMNGYLTADQRIHAPTTTVDHTPVEYRELVDASGYKHVQLNNGLFRRTGAGLLGPISYQNYLSQAQPIIPGQRRDNFGGYIPRRGIDPLSYQALWQNGPGAQPSNPGGPGKIASQYFVNPGTS